MSKVCGLEIEDPRLVRIARGLLYSQGLILLLSLAFGILQIVLQLVFRNALAKAESSNVETSEGSFSSGFGMSMMQGLLSAGVPFSLMVFARAALEGSHSDWIMLLSIADACGACCSCVAMISSCANVIFYQFLAKWSEDYDCASLPVHGGLPFAEDTSQNSTLNRVPTLADMARCRQGMEESTGLFRLLGNLAIVATIFGVLDVFLCGFAARKATEANSMLKQDFVFVGVPRQQPLREVCTQPAAMGGTVVVVGQPVSSPLPPSTEPPRAPGPAARGVWPGAAAPMASGAGAEGMSLAMAAIQWAGCPASLASAAASRAPAEASEGVPLAMAAIQRVD